MLQSFSAIVAKQAAPETTTSIYSIASNLQLLFRRSSDHPFIFQAAPRSHSVINFTRRVERCVGMSIVDSSRRTCADCRGLKKLLHRFRIGQRDIVARCMLPFYRVINFRRKRMGSLDGQRAKHAGQKFGPLRVRLFDEPQEPRYLRSSRLSRGNPETEQPGESVERSWRQRRFNVRLAAPTGLANFRATGETLQAPGFSN